MDYPNTSRNLLRFLAAIDPYSLIKVDTACESITESAQQLPGKIFKSISPSWFLGEVGGSVSLKWMGINHHVPQKNVTWQKRGNVKVVGPTKWVFFRRNPGGILEGGYPVQTQNVRLEDQKTKLLLQLLWESEVS